MHWSSWWKFTESTSKCITWDLQKNICGVHVGQKPVTLPKTLVNRYEFCATWTPPRIIILVSQRSMQYMNIHEYVFKACIDQFMRRWKIFKYMHCIRLTKIFAKHTLYRNYYLWVTRFLGNVTGILYNMYAANIFFVNLK